MKTIAIVTFICLPAMMWLVARWLNRRYIRRTEATLDACECTAIQKQATKMHSAVDAKIRAMDSRDPDSGRVTTPATPPTDELPLISIVIALLLSML